MLHSMLFLAALSQRSAPHTYSSLEASSYFGTTARYSIFDVFIQYKCDEFPLPSALQRVLRILYPPLDVTIQVSSFPFSGFTLVCANARLSLQSEKTHNPRPPKRIVSPVPRNASNIPKAQRLCFCKRQLRKIAKIKKIRPN